MTIDDMVLAYQRGDRTYEERLMLLGYSFTRAVIAGGGYHLPYTFGTREDLVQEGMFGYVESLASWRADKGRFSTHAWNCVRANIISALKMANRRKHMPLNDSRSIDAKSRTRDQFEQTLSCDRYATIANGDAVDALEYVATREWDAEAVVALRILLAEFSPLERTSLVRCMLKQERYDVVGAEVGRNYKSIDNAISRVLKHLPKRASTLAKDVHIDEGVREVLQRIAMRPSIGVKRARRADFWCGDLVDAM